MTATQKFHHDYPYRLRLQHPDHGELRIERKGRWIRIDPAEPVTGDEVVVLTGPSPWRIRATVEAVREGRNPTVVAPRALLDWLRGQGALVACEAPSVLDGVTVATMPYVAARAEGPLGALRASIGARLQRGRLPGAICPPTVVALTFPDQSRLVHLDLALHEGTDESWVRAAAEAFGGADWLVVGCVWGEGEALVRHVAAFGARRVLVAELTNAERREQGLPTALVTPIRDRLVAAGVEAHVFATQTSYRFE